MTYTVQQMPSVGDTVLVGMSGGVDSTLTALLLKNKGCRVIGITMSIWDNGRIHNEQDSNNFSHGEEEKKHKKNSLPKKIREGCYGPGEEENIAECKKFCEANGIEYHVADVRQQYKQSVLEYFKREYRSGRTPNPCVMCNRNIKFGAMLEQIDALGIRYDFFCTGHYAKIVRPDMGIWGTGERPFMIAASQDAAKDQTYFLYRIPSKILQKVRFPLAEMKKSQVFELARRQNLDVANREESQDFVGAEYFDELFSDKPGIPGDIIDLDGHVLGKHRGIEHYTVGQRRGLGVAVNYPVYVHSIDAKNNVVVLAPKTALYSTALIADDFVWPAGVEPPEPFDALVKIRLASRPVLCIVERFRADDDRLCDAGVDGSFAGQPWLITFEEPQRAVAPGQSAVLYKDGVIVGGGVICGAINKP